MSTTIFWTAHNDSRYLTGYRQANSLRAAVRDARHYLDNELYGNGIICYFAGEPGEWDSPIRIDAKRFPGDKWRTEGGM